MASEKVADFLYRVTRGDSQYWVARFQIDGVRYDVGLGSCAKVTLREARLKAAKAVAKPPKKKKKTKLDDKKLALFKDVWGTAMEEIASIKQWKREKMFHRWANSISTYALPILGDKKVSAITREDILEVIKPLWFTRIETADRVRQRLETILSWAEVRGYRSGTNPARWDGNLSFFLPSRSKVEIVKHREAPTVEELKTVVRYCLAHPSRGHGLILFVIATVCRVNEARCAELGEIEGGIWTVPKAHQKVGDDRRVPLSALATQGLGMADQGDIYYFEHNERPLALDTPRILLQRLCGRAVTAHGIRSTFRDWCAREGLDDNAAELCLGHVIGTQTSRAYFRDDLFDKRKDILDRWSKMLLTK